MVAKRLYASQGTDVLQTLNQTWFKEKDKAFTQSASFKKQMTL